MSNPQPAPPMLYDIILRWCDHPTVYVGVDAIVQIIEQHPGERDWVAALSFPVGQQRAMVTFKVNPGGPSVKQIGAITLRRLGGAMELIPTPVDVIGLRQLGPGVWKPLQPVIVPGVIAGYMTFINVPEPPPWVKPKDARTDTPWRVRKHGHLGVVESDK